MLESLIVEKNPYVVKNLNEKIASYIDRAEKLKKQVEGFILIFISS